MEYLHQLADGNFHYGGLRAARVGTVDRVTFRRICDDVETVIATMPPSEVKVGHITNWTNPIGRVRQWSLYNRHGRTDDTSNDFSYKLAGKRVHEGLPAISELAASLPDLVNLRLNVMDPGAALSPHEEHLPRAIGSDRVGLRARFHLPIATNPKALMMADGDLFHFDPGTIYLFNNGCVHAAENGGDAPRAHLVWDQLMTEEAYEAMLSKVEPIDVVSKVTIGDYAKQGGMSQREFSRRTLAFMP